MKKILVAITVAAFLGYPIFTFAAYVIHLKNGAKLVADQFYEKGEQIRFKRYGGEIGIEKNLIKSIVEVKEPLENSVVEEKALTPALPEKMKSDEGKDPAETVEAQKEPDSEDGYKKKKATLEKMLKEALADYKKAKEFGDQAMIDAEFRRASEFSSELSKLEKEVKSKHDGALPAWWGGSETKE